MSIFPKLRFKKKQNKILERKDIDVLLESALAPFIKREELKEYLDKIERDKEKKKLWDTLSLRKKIEVVRYVMNKRSSENAKKKS